MPVRNEGAFIEISLGSVLRQSVGLENMEILVIDGMSEDDTRERITELQACHPEAHIRILDNARRIAPCALNIGLRNATGDIVVRVDGHCEIGEHYVAHAIAHLENGADGVGGPLKTLGEGITARAIAAAMSSRFGVGGVAFRTNEADLQASPPLNLEAVREVDTVAFAAYTRGILEKAGFFDEEFVRNQDDEYNYRLRKMGARLVLADDMPAEYYSRSGFHKLWQQYFQYGYWKVRVLQRHPRQMSRRQFVPALFVLSLLVACLGIFVAPREATPLLLAVISAYALANFVATWITVASARGQGEKQPLAMAIRLPLAYLLLHIGYGSGFLLGLVRFLGHWRDPIPSQSS